MEGIQKELKNLEGIWEGTGKNLEGIGKDLEGSRDKWKRFLLMEETRENGLWETFCVH